MRVPKGASGWFGTTCRWLERLYSKPPIQYFVAPALLALPPWLVKIAIDSQAVNRLLHDISPGLADFLDKYDVLFLVLASIYSWLVLRLAKSIAKRAESGSPDTKGLIALVASLDNIVGAKLLRFEGYLRSRRSNSSAHDTFDAITQPRLQIAEITRGIADFFNATRPATKSHLIRVVLAEIEDQKIRAIPLSFPNDEPIRSTVRELNKPNSAIMTSVRTKKIVVVESIVRELKKNTGACYVDTGNDDDNVGSIICFPVLSGSTVAFVVSVHCDEDRYFKKALTDLYTLWLKRFAIRLSLEYSLIQLKESVHGSGPKSP